MTTDSGFVWADYVDWIATTSGSLAAAADRLCAHRGYKDDVGSVERALRRLRRRGMRDGGTWGTRALALFGLPEAVGQRVRWLGQYHARFTDLPVPVCADLVRAWDRPPTTESRDGRAWLALAHAGLALRRRDDATALQQLDRARGELATAPPAARIEGTLIRAYVASAALPAELDALLAAVDDPDDHACLRARRADHLAYAHNRAGDHAAGEAVFRALPDAGPAFARARRAGGLAYARWKLGAPLEGAALAAAAAEHAGDGGHVRARAMALALRAAILAELDPAAALAERTRAIAIAHALDDATLIARFNR